MIRWIVGVSKEIEKELKYKSRNAHKYRPGTADCITCLLGYSPNVQGFLETLRSIVFSVLHKCGLHTSCRVSDLKKGDKENLLSKKSMIWLCDFVFEENDLISARRKNCVWCQIFLVAVSPSTKDFWELLNANISNIYFNIQLLYKRGENHETMFHRCDNTVVLQWSSSLYLNIKLLIKTKTSILVSFIPITVIV